MPFAHALGGGAHLVAIGVAMAGQDQRFSFDADLDFGAGFPADLLQNRLINRESRRIPDGAQSLREGHAPSPRLHVSDHVITLLSRAQVPPVAHLIPGTRSPAVARL